MKTHSDRWKGVEKEVAAYISRFFVRFGEEQARRIPILGREGPDITPIAGLIIDVKHRKEIPQCIFPTSEIGISGDLISVRLEYLWLLLLEPEMETLKESKIVRDWYEHIKLSANDGIAVVICHKPRTPINQSTLLINEGDWRSLRHELCTRIRVVSSCRPARTRTERNRSQSLTCRRTRLHRP